MTKKSAVNELGGHALDALQRTRELRNRDWCGVAYPH